MTTKITNPYTKTLTTILVQIEQAKVRAMSAVNETLIRLYWSIGQILSEQADYGKETVEQLSQDLRLRYPQSRGYSARNLWNMKRFYETYNKMQTVSAELLYSVSWSNHVLLLNQTESDEEKEFYIKSAIKERWTYRELRRQIDSAFFERYMLADKPERVWALLPKPKQDDLARHFKDEYILEFLNLGKHYTERQLQDSILDNMRDFFLEFGRAFTFLGSEYPLPIGKKEFRIDLLFFHRELNCLVAVELKIGEFKAAYAGQMQMYLAALDEKVRMPGEQDSIGLILCKSKDHEEVRFALAHSLSPMKIADYKTKLPDKKLILAKLKQLKFKG